MSAYRHDRKPSCCFQHHLIDPRVHAWQDVPVFLCGMCPIEQMKPSTVTSHAYNFGGFDSGALDFGISHVRSAFLQSDTSYGAYSWPPNELLPSLPNAVELCPPCHMIVKAPMHCGQCIAIIDVSEMIHCHETKAIEDVGCGMHRA